MSGVPDSHLEAEIAEQPEVVGHLVDALQPRVGRLRSWLAGRRVTHIVLAARGSSDNVARYGQYLLAIRARLTVGLATPSVQTRYGVTPRMDGALVVGVSQSGRSPDVVGVLEAARSQGRPTVAITNALDSPLAAAADEVLHLDAGEERSVAATKTYTASLVAMAMLGLALGDEPTGTERDELAALPALMERTLNATRAGSAEALVGAATLVVTGRGLNLATAHEGALKIRELTGMRTEAFSPPDLLHGPVAAVAAGDPVLLVAPAEPSIEDQRQLAPTLRERGARLAVISGDRDLLDTADIAFALPEQPAPWLTPVTAVLPAQLVAAEMARARGLDLDRPVGLRKVTETR
jgi:glutamine---fructose-6-phosphate transaminase (isomerizing)